MLDERYRERVVHEDLQDEPRLEAHQQAFPSRRTTYNL
jgi:hypothetical protein